MAGSIVVNVAVEVVALNVHQRVGRLLGRSTLDKNLGIAGKFDLGRFVCLKNSHKKLKGGVLMGEYLYGASCQGIQSFIFETDKLREIVGGSELVEQLCTTDFEYFLTKLKVSDFEKITGAAGNIRYIFKKEDAEKVVWEFPKHAVDFAPGITISQAVQKIGDTLSKEDMDALERKLKAQRNMAWRPANLGFQAVERCRRTARPAVKRGKKESLLDKGIVKKQEACGTKASQTLLKKLVPPKDLETIGGKNIPYEMEDMIDDKKSEWLAVIHADGNNLGKMIQEMAGELSKNPKQSVSEAYKEFSSKLERATVQAAQGSFQEIFISGGHINPDSKMPIRPIIIGGDDLTVICRANLAIAFTCEFLTLFQKKTKSELAGLFDTFHLQQFKNGLTACAGIAFVKPKYPFHYAVGLAEELCAAAKKASKSVDQGSVPASLAFFKVRSSYLDSYEDLCQRELRAGTNKRIHLDYGPYSLEKRSDMACIEELIENVNSLKNKNAPVAALRKWLSALGRDEDEAKQLMTRMNQITSQKKWQDFNHEKAVNNEETPVADWLTILSLDKGAKA